MWKTTLAALALLVPGGPAAMAGERNSTSPVELSRFQWAGRIEAGRTIRVENDYGQVRARFGGYDGRVEVQATLQRLEVKGPELKVRVDEADEGVLVTVGYDPADAPQRARRDRADVVVLVPKGAALAARTARDLIEVKGVGGVLDLSSVKGDIAVKTGSGQIKARTERGAITVTLDPGAGAGQPHALESVQGDIALYLAETANATIVAETSGEISTDWSIEIDHRRLEEPDKRATAVVNKGGEQSIFIASKRGRVRLLRLTKNLPRAHAEP